MAYYHSNSQPSRRHHSLGREADRSTRIGGNLRSKRMGNVHLVASMSACADRNNTVSPHRVTSGRLHGGLRQANPQPSSTLPLRRPPTSTADFERDPTSAKGIPPRAPLVAWAANLRTSIASGPMMAWLTWGQIHEKRCRGEVQKGSLHRYLDLLGHPSAWETNCRNAYGKSELAWTSGSSTASLSSQTFNRHRRRSNHWETSNNAFSTSRSRIIAGIVCSIS
jgi:hypothetical protein